MAKVTRVLMEWEHSGGDIAICPATDEEVAVYLRKKGYVVTAPKGPWKLEPTPYLRKFIDSHFNQLRCVSDGLCYPTFPAKHKCRHCGQMWSKSGPPICKKQKEERSV